MLIATEQYKQEILRGWRIMADPKLSQRYWDYLVAMRYHKLQSDFLNLKLILPAYTGKIRDLMNTPAGFEDAFLFEHANNFALNNQL